jgi:hypothetical protein
MSFPAKYPGFCLPCGEPIKQQEFIINDPQHGYIHEECTDIEPAQSAPERRESSGPTHAVMPPGKTPKDRCSQCFLVHTPAQGEECQ